MNPEIEALKAQVAQLEAKLNLFMKSDKYLWDKNMQILDGRDVQLGRTTGARFGTATDQKISFLGAAPKGRYNMEFPVTAANIYTAFSASGYGLFYNDTGVAYGF